MNADSVFQYLQQGARIALGATASLGETLQDPQQREQLVAALSQQLSEKAQEFSQKGEVTEREARQQLERWLDGQAPQGSNSPEQPSAATASPPTSATAPASTQDEIRQMIETLGTLRGELARYRQSGG